MNFIKTNFPNAINLFKKSNFTAHKIPPPTVYFNKKSESISIGIENNNNKNTESKQIVSKDIGKTNNSTELSVSFNKQAETVKISTENKPSIKTHKDSINYKPKKSQTATTEVYNPLTSLQTSVAKTVRQPQKAIEEIYTQPNLQKITLEALENNTLEFSTTNILFDIFSSDKLTTPQIKLAISMLKDIAKLKNNEHITKHKILDIMLPILTNNLREVAVTEYINIKYNLLRFFNQAKNIDKIADMPLSYEEVTILTNDDLPPTYSDFIQSNNILNTTNNYSIKSAKDSANKTMRLIDIFFQSLEIKKSDDLIKHFSKPIWTIDNRAKLLNTEGICQINTYKNILRKLTKNSSPETHAKQNDEVFLLNLMDKANLNKKKNEAEIIKNEYTKNIKKYAELIQEKNLTIDSRNNFIFSRDKFGEKLKQIIKEKFPNKNNLLVIDLRIPMSDKKNGHSTMLVIKDKINYYSIEFYDSNLTQASNQQYSYSKDLYIGKTELEENHIECPLKDYGADSNIILFNLIETNDAAKPQKSPIKRDDITLQDITNNPFLFYHITNETLDTYLNYLLSDQISEDTIFKTLTKEPKNNNYGIASIILYSSKYDNHSKQLLQKAIDKLSIRYIAEKPDLLIYASNEKKLAALDYLSDLNLTNKELKEHLSKKHWHELDLKECILYNASTFVSFKLDQVINKSNQSYKEYGSSSGIITY
ncbi:MAG: hypothetical protein LW807_03510 [Proteobacteria bacterium]|jgi:hypothetical protein|nr:hypothetical protein [Pseudomonadota bacterium]